jgi:hypothetical protein
MPHGYRVRVIRRPPRSLLAVVALAAAVVLGGCVGQAPAPSPTPTGFADEAEAFAAAEETYRAYVDALNAVDLSDPATFEDVYAWTTGELNAADRDSFSTWHAEGYRISGAGVVRALTGLTASPEAARLRSCYDVSGIQIVDAKGQSVVAADRTDIQALVIEVELDSGKVAAISPDEDAPQC